MEVESGISSSRPADAWALDISNSGETVRTAVVGPALDPPSQTLMEGLSKSQFNKLCPLKCENHVSIAVFPEPWYLFPPEHNTFATWMNFLRTFSC